MIAITGATGFIGKNLVKSLADDGREITVLVRNNRKINSFKGLDIVIKKGDLLDKESLKSFVQGNRYLIHLASVISSRNQGDYSRVNVEGMKNIVETSQTLGIKKFIYISSIDAQISPDSLYGSTKAAAEKILEKSSLDYVILRPSVIYGEYDTRNIMTMIKAARRLPFFPMIGDGSYKRQPLFVGDIIWAIKRVLDAEKTASKKYNIGGPDVLSLNEIVGIILKLIKKRKAVIHFPVGLADIFFKTCAFLNFNLGSNLEQIKSITDDKFFDISLIKEELLFNPTDFKQGLNLLLEKVR